MNVLIRQSQLEAFLGLFLSESNGPKIVKKRPEVKKTNYNIISIQKKKLRTSERNKNNNKKKIKMQSKKLNLNEERLLGWSSTTIQQKILCSTVCWFSTILLLSTKLLVHIYYIQLQCLHL